MRSSNLTRSLSKRAAWGGAWVAAIGAASGGCQRLLSFEDLIGEEAVAGQGGGGQAGNGPTEGGAGAGGGSAGMAGGSGLSCLPDSSPCGEVCANLQTDAKHCGRCDVACAGVGRCEEGICTGVAEVAAGGQFTCALLTNGRVRCWGANDRGQLGNGLPANSSAPVEISAIEGVAQISTGFAHACARKGDGGLWCWGDNATSQLGDGTTDPSPQPKRVAGSVSEITAVATGRDHSCVVTGANVQCWGRNDFGQTGIDKIAKGEVIASPTPVQGIFDLISIKTGADHTCALRDDGLAFCWGSNQQSQLGCLFQTCNDESPGYNDSTYVPTAVYSVVANHIGQLALGRRHSCALLADETVLCWGENEYGQVGLGVSSYMPISKPTAVVNLTEATQLSSSADHTCALHKDGTVWCWGLNDRGQLGDGTKETRKAPTQVATLTQAMQVSAGEGHTCARSADGSAWCWGSNASGQLGSGNILESLLPTPVANLEPSP